MSITDTFADGCGFPDQSVHNQLKANRGEADQQSTLEISTVILVGTFGIAAVELGGRKGAKICWWIVVALFGLSIRNVVAAFGLP